MWIWLSVKAQGWQPKSRPALTVTGFPGSEHVGDDLALEHVALIRVAVAAAVRAQGQARRGHVVVDVEAFRVAHPGGVFAAGHLAFIIQAVNFPALVVKRLDLLEPLVPLQGLGQGHQHEPDFLRGVEFRLVGFLALELILDFGVALADLLAVERIIEAVFIEVGVGDGQHDVDRPDFLALVPALGVPGLPGEARPIFLAPILG